MDVSIFNLGEIRLVSVVANVLGDVFPELKQQQEHIRHVIQEEEESFGRTLVKVRMDMCEDVFMGCHFLVAVRVIFVL
jgi:alanyl-tRNA synthetase